MNIIILSDIHGSLSNYDRIKEKVAKADLVLLSGDITHFGRRNEVEAIINIIRKNNNHILAVPGNCDYSDVSRYLVEEGISLHCRYHNVLNMQFIGVGGSLPCPGKTPFEFTEEELGDYLHMTFEDNLVKKPFILLSHQPPFGTINDKVNGMHVGSKQIREFIENTQPLVCFCGHIHEGVGIDKIGSTYIVNPGPFREGKYAYAVLENNNITTELFR
ncbi:MAG: metallophosphoesterase family protein [Bacteroidales bacterium]|nr:metallophosphoesterase family protein [Bacteroidales bacterium]